MSFTPSFTPSFPSRYLAYNPYWWNETLDNADEFTAQLKPAADLSVDAVMTSLYLNTIVFIVLLMSYELLRRLLPSVYAARKRAIRNDVIMMSGNSEENENNAATNGAAASGSSKPRSRTGRTRVRRTDYQSSSMMDLNRTTSLDNLLTSTDDSAPWKPLDWVGPVFGISWNTVRRTAGLDAYFFLRYIRMNVRIAAVSTFWAFLLLAPVYATGHNHAEGWYHISMTNINIEEDSWRIVVSVAFMYLFSAFIFFVMKQEYSHYMELRMDFLGRQMSQVDPQHHFSLMVENIPLELRSDEALRNYFEKLFPGRVHSASVIRKLPDLESLGSRRLRVTRRLEKSIAYYHATGVRPSHIMGQARMSVAGIDMSPLVCAPCCQGMLKRGCCKVCCGEEEVTQVPDEGPFPQKGTRVDSISYYTRDLAECNREMHLLQQKQQDSHDGATFEPQDTIPAAASASSQNPTPKPSWFTALINSCSQAASTVMEDSAEDNALYVKRHTRESQYFLKGSIPQAEQMTSMYGSFSAKGSGGAGGSSTMAATQSVQEERVMLDQKQKQQQPPDLLDPEPDENQQTMAGLKRHEQVLGAPSTTDYYAFDQSRSFVSWDSADTSSTTSNRARLIAQDQFDDANREFVHPNSRHRNKSRLRRIIGRLGLDFVVAGVKYMNRQLDILVASVVGSTMSSTGFVTFLDLTSVTSAVSVPLTHKPNVLKVSVAPEPRDIRWNSAHVSTKLTDRRELITNVLLSLGVILWSIPLTAIQAFATAEQVAQIPGFEWILNVNGGKLRAFINGYLPVVALLTLIILLPILFEFVAVRYEHRKTFSDVQRSMLTRYFYYQLVNIYVTVTAGSLWESLADILDHPGNILQILGLSLPKVVGYFVSLLITKILAGLPIIVLRVGALTRMLFLRAIFSQEKLTQRELDGVYRKENVLYGWEYPSQLLVIVICFTYAVICPVILPFGAIYFVGSLMVYKKQVLYVYTPIYESGGSMFPAACDCTLFGLFCGQLTLIGYVVIRQCFYEPLWLMPLPFFTLWVMRYFRVHYAQPSNYLSLERAKERDRISDIKTCMSANVPYTPGRSAERRRQKFDKDSYRQPVLSVHAFEPLPYRRGQPDPVTDDAKRSLKRHNRYKYTTADSLGSGGGLVMVSQQELQGIPLSDLQDCYTALEEIREGDDDDNNNNSSHGGSSSLEGPLPIV